MTLPSSTNSKMQRKARIMIIIENRYNSYYYKILVHIWNLLYHYFDSSFINKKNILFNLKRIYIIK